jgi:ABC-type dipeptide/oligopeptide/nickel transport systems, permease components
VAAFLARRIAQGLAVVLLVATIVFFLIHAAPGDPFSASMENPAITESVRATWRHAYGLDRPLGEQYIRYVESVARGDLGFSFSLQRPVSDALANALPNTLLLMSVALAGGFIIGIAVAVAQVRRRGKTADHVLGGISIFLFSVPDFWLAMLLLVALAYWLPLFPIGGSVDPVMHDMMSGGARALDRIRHLILPGLTLALLYFPLIARHQRAALLEAITSDYITTGRAKGVPEGRLVTRHALRNALLPVVSILGVAFPALLTGAVFVENVFSWPGMGRLIVNSIGSRDYPLLTAAVLLGSVFVVAGSILADALYRLLDPRLRDEF